MRGLHILNAVLVLVIFMVLVVSTGYKQKEVIEQPGRVELTKEDGLKLSKRIGLNSNDYKYFYSEKNFINLDSKVAYGIAIILTVAAIVYTLLTKKNLKIYSLLNTLAIGFMVIAFLPIKVTDRNKIFALSKESGYEWEYSSNIEYTKGKYDNLEIEMIGTNLIINVKD